MDGCSFTGNAVLSMVRVSRDLNLVRSEYGAVIFRVEPGCIFKVYQNYCN